jgi:hypothetical protein
MRGAAEEQVADVVAYRHKQQGQKKIEGRIYAK